MFQLQPPGQIRYQWLGIARVKPETGLSGKAVSERPLVKSLLELHLFPSEITQALLKPRVLRPFPVLGRKSLSEIKGPVDLAQAKDYLPVHSYSSLLRLILILDKPSYLI
ncbi:MAG TPA: hypothetical protein VGL11_05540 [Candidatus Binatia bacterium]